jgi:hypothetical protein
MSYLHQKYSLEPEIPGHVPGYTYVAQIVKNRVARLCTKFSILFLGPGDNFWKSYDKNQGADVTAIIFGIVDGGWWVTSRLQITSSILWQICFPHNFFKAPYMYDFLGLGDHLWKKLWRKQICPTILLRGDLRPAGDPAPAIDDSKNYMGDVWFCFRHNFFKKLSTWLKTSLERCATRISTICAKNQALK